MLACGRDLAAQDTQDGGTGVDPRVGERVRPLLYEGLRGTHAVHRAVWLAEGPECERLMKAGDGRWLLAVRERVHPEALRFVELVHVQEVAERLAGTAHVEESVAQV